jgi:hypothetical protein
MRHAIVLASLFLSAGSALGDAGPGSDVARAPVTYTLTGKWKGTARTGGLVQLVTVDADLVAYWSPDLRRCASVTGIAVVLYPDGTARLTRQGGKVPPDQGTYRRAGGRIHIRFCIRSRVGTWLWDIEYVGPGKWRLGERPDK